MAELGSGITYFQPTEETPVMIHSVDRASLTGSLVRVEPNHPQSIAFTSLGPVIPGVSIRIVNDHDSVLPENTIGHLQVQGAAVSPGYYKDPEANEQVFLKDGWFNTGDRGFIANAQLYVTGRDKETVIINGVNYYSREIELAVEEVDGIAASFTAACAVRPWNADTEQLAIFFHSPIADDARLVQLIRNIQAHVTKKVGVKPDYLLPVEQNVIPKTSIGKIQRKQLTLRFESGECDDLVKHVDILLRNKNTLPNWFYELHWRPKLLRHGKPSTESLAERVMILTHTNVGYRDHPLQAHFPARAAPVVVETGAFLGAGCIVLPGVRVGSRAFVAAGSVVNADVTAGTLVAGVPARVVRPLEPGPPAS
jgi:hypothetical protein